MVNIVILFLAPGEISSLYGSSNLILFNITHMEDVYCV